MLWIGNRFSHCLYNHKANGKKCRWLLICFVFCVKISLSKDVIVIFNSEILHIEERNTVPYMSFKIFDGIDCVKNAISTRHGGVSVGDALSSLNLGTSTSDDWDNVVENYRIFCDAAGYDINRLVLARQTHSVNVMAVDDSFAGCGVLRERYYDNIDALITDTPNLPLVIHTADCVPVAIVDPVHKAVGNAHCGWRGTFGELAKITLQAMGDRYGTRPQDVVVAIGPCICVDCYEVSEELYIDFLQKFGYTEYIINREDRFFLNLPMINRQLLADYGVPADSIAVADVCTCCEREHLFSHRGLGPGRGILGTFISIKD